MSQGEHNHTGTPNLDEHLKNCEDYPGHGDSETYIHKHFADCLEGDPNATMIEKPEGVNIVRFKIIILITFIVICFAGIIPKAWSGCSKHANALSLLNCFAAGMFLAMALMHLLPEGVEMYDSWAKQEGIEEPFPLAYLMFFVGFLLVLLVDRVIARACTGGHGHGHHGEQVPNTERRDVEMAGTAPRNAENTQLGTPAINSEEKEPNGETKVSPQNEAGEANVAEGEGSAT